MSYIHIGCKIVYVLLSVRDSLSSDECTFVLNVRSCMCDRWTDNHCEEDKDNN